MKLSVNFLAVWKALGQSYCHIEFCEGSTSAVFQPPRALPFSGSWVSQGGFSVYTLESEIGAFWSYSKEGPYQDWPPLCPFRLLPLLTCS